jgi:hypothetical protein
MRNGRFNTAKCRGKLQKMGVLFTHSFKKIGPSPNFLISLKKNIILFIFKSKNSKVVRLSN